MPRLPPMADVMSAAERVPPKCSHRAELHASILAGCRDHGLADMERGPLRDLVCYARGFALGLAGPEPLLEPLPAAALIDRLVRELLEARRGGPAAARAEVQRLEPSAARSKIAAELADVQGAS